MATLLTDENVTELKVQTDNHKCAFGQWLYGDGRERAEKEIPALASIMKEIESHHQKFHESAIEIGQHFQQVDADLPGILAARMVDHLKWADVIRDAFLENKTSLEVQTDPTRCTLGQWLHSEQAQKAYNRARADLKKAWDEMLVTHQKLHESTVDVCKHIGQAEQGRVEAKRVFDEKTLPLFHQRLQHMEAMKLSANQALEGVNKAKEVYVTQTKPCLKKVQELLGQAAKDVAEVTHRANQDMLTFAKSTKLSVSVLSFAAILAGIAAGILIARGIIAALEHIIASLKEGSEQVAAASGQVSAASQSLAEGATEAAILADLTRPGMRSPTGHRAASQWARVAPGERRSTSSRWTSVTVN